MNNIVLFEDLFDVSVVLLQSTLRDHVTIHWCLTPTRLSAIRLTAD